MEMSESFFVWDRTTKIIIRSSDGVSHVLRAIFLVTFILKLVSGTFSGPCLMAAVVLPPIISILAMLLCATKIRVYADKVEIFYGGHVLKASDTFFGNIEMLPDESDSFCKKHKLDRAVFRVSLPSNDNMDFPVIVPNKK